MDKKKLAKGSLIAAGILTAGYFVTKKVAKSKADKRATELNKDNPYLNPNAEGAFTSFKKQTNTRHETTYERVLKPTVDSILAYCGLVVLSPVYGATALAIYLDDPGPVLFTQKRVGKGCEMFELHKFRSMKMSTPHDMPTHMLANPDQYITKVGRFIRKYSLDELPQIWDILSGKMSIIGPRPALWNQDDLVAEREKWGANDVVPGLTGWAQINGRDELEIPVKAKLDGEYCDELQKGGAQAMVMDAKCFLGTVSSVLHHDGVVEGGTGGLDFHDYTVSDEHKISIIMPAYNAASFISESIESVLAQTYKNWELIVVDDCSTDNTAEIVEELQKEDPRIKLIRHEVNQGVAATRNTALDAADGDFIAFLDSDDKWTENKLEFQLGFMLKNDYVLTYTSYQKFDSDTGVCGKTIICPDKMTAKDIYKNTAIACLTVMVNRRAVGAFHMPPLNHTEDQITWQEILNRGFVAYGLKDTLAYYREGNTSLTCNQKASAKKQWETYRGYYGFSLVRSAYYFSFYALNAVKKHFM